MYRTDYFDTSGFLRAVRERQRGEDVSDRELARHTGLHTTLVGLVLNGKRGLSLRTASALAVWADVSLDEYLLDGAPR
jgi:transcriptional regulator with XRE-family HTH domain